MQELGWAKWQAKIGIGGGNTKFLGHFEDGGQEGAGGAHGRKLRGRPLDRGPCARNKKSNHFFKHEGFHHVSSSCYEYRPVYTRTMHASQRPLYTPPTAPPREKLKVSCFGSEPLLYSINQSS